MKLHSGTIARQFFSSRMEILNQELRAMQRRHGEDQLLRAVLIEVDRGARVRPRSLDLDNDAGPESVVHDPVSDFQSQLLGPGRANRWCRAGAEGSALGEISAAASEAVRVAVVH